MEKDPDLKLLQEDSRFKELAACARQHQTLRFCSQDPEWETLSAICGQGAYRALRLRECGMRWRGVELN
jgi:hypothetical protein